MCQSFIAWDIQNSLDVFGLVLQCRDLLVYVYCLFGFGHVATMSPSGT